MMDAGFVQMIIDRTPFLRRVALGLTRNASDADDLVQDTLLLALRNRGRFADGTRMEAWLYTILRNSYINRYRKEKRKKRIDRELAGDQRTATQSNEGVSRLLSTTICEKIEELPFIYRRPLKLTLAGYRYGEIAAITGRPLGTVKSQIHLGRTLLKRSLQFLADEWPKRA